LPSVPTSRATRVTSAAKERSLIDHRVDGVLELEDLARTSTVILRDRSPFATAVVTVGDVTDLAGEMLAMKLTLSVRSFQVPGHALDLGLPARRPRCRPRARRG